MKHELCKITDIPAEGKSLIVPFFGRELHVYKTDGRYRAVANVCLHFGGPLDCKDGQLVCPWHGASFAMDTGARLDGPAPAESKLMFLTTRAEAHALYDVWGE
jgi:nitrite reductase/ring-hydroxylating ferredoxin subunit